MTEHRVELDDNRFAARVFYRAFWGLLLCVAFPSLCAIGAIAASGQAGGASKNSDDLAVALGSIGACGLLSLALPVAILSWKDLAKATSLLSHPDWNRLTRSARFWMGWFLFGWLIPFLGPVLSAVSLFLWPLRLIQLCGLVAVLCNSDILHRRVKEMRRNLWILLGETVGLIVIGCLLAAQPGHPFLRILAVLLLLFLVYCIVYLMVVLRMAGHALEKKHTG